MSKAKKWIWISLKSLVTVLCFYFLFVQFQQKNVSFDELQIPKSFAAILILQFFLMLLNWCLEVFRWKLSVEVVEEISYKQAMIDVLGGLTMNWILPFTIGDYVARIAAKKDRYKSTSAILLNRGIMLMLTSIVGIFGIFVFLGISVYIHHLLLGLILVAIIIIVLLKTVPQKIMSYFTTLARSTLWKIILISIGRYAVFFLQFIILLKLFNADLPIVLLSAGTGWIFFIRTSIPSMLGGIGLRETSAFVFFEGLVVDPVTIIFPVFVLWILNTAVPSAVGAMLLWKLKAHNS